MSEIRCLVCGSSKLDPEGYKCGRCGAAIGLRQEQCYVSEETKKKLLDHADELSKFGINLEQSESVSKHWHIGDIGTGLTIIEAIRPGTLGDLVLFLRKLAVPEEEILRLRLGEPEEILTYCRRDKET
jgi:hypothetical protein